jgi:hypothetical protein
VVSAIAHGSFLTYFRNAKTAEIPFLADGLFKAESAYNVLTGSFLEAGPMTVAPSNPAGLSGEKIVNSQSDVANNTQFKELGYVPEDDLYGSVQAKFPVSGDPYYDAVLDGCKCNINIFIWQDLNDGNVLEEYIQNARKNSVTDNVYKYDQSGASEASKLNVNNGKKGDNGKHLGWYK